MINVTENALKHIREAMAAEGKPGLSLRLYVEGGGCSGLQYGLAFEEQGNEGDEVVSQDGISILIDRFSAPYLKGITVDYVSSLAGSGFKISNPNASGSCGCGHSFKV